MTNDELKLPSPNPLLDKEPPELKSLPGRNLPSLFLLIPRIGMRAWYAPAPSDTFKIPKSFVYIKMSHSTKSNFNARDSAINRSGP